MVKAEKQTAKKAILVSCALSLVTLAMVYLAAGLFPFGQNTLVWGDFGSQVVPFLTQAKQILAGVDGTLYSTANAAGMNFVGVALYFIASPFTLLGIFVPLAYFYHFANVLVLLKVLTASFTAAWFFGGKRAPFKVGSLSAGVLGSMYALGGYTFLYYQNNVWLDALYLLPLLAIALVYMAQEGKAVPYALVMAAVVVCQFQLAFTVVIALLVCGGLCVALFMPKHKGAMFSLRLFLGTLAAGLLSAAGWAPALLSYSRSARLGNLLDNFWGVELKTHYYTTAPVLLCTASLFAAVVWLLATRAYKKPKVRFVLLSFALLCVPVFVEPINKMWHGGSYQSFPARFGFITLLLGLVLVAAVLEGLRQLPDIQHTRTPYFLVCCGLVAGYTLVLLYILLFHGNEADAYVRSLWGNKTTLKWGVVSALVGAACILVLFFLRRKLKIGRGLVAFVLAGLVLAQGVYNGRLYIGSPARGTEGYFVATDMAGRMPEGNTARVKASRMYMDANTIGALGYASIAHYSSFTREEYLQAYKKLGYSGYWMELSGFGGTALSDYFFNIGGIIVRTNGSDPAFDENALVYQNEGFGMRLVESGGYGVLTSADAKTIATIPEGDRFAAQQWLWQNLYGVEEELFVRYEPSVIEGVNMEEYNQLDKYGVWLDNSGMSGRLVYTIEAGEATALYFDCFRYISNSLEEIVNNGLGVRINGEVFESSYPNSGANGILYLGTFENETVEIQIDVWRSELVRSFGVVGLPESSLQAAVAQAQTVDAVLNNGNGSFTVQAGEGQMLVLAYAYDEGFSATVNGEAAEVHRVLDAFMAVELVPGENVVVVRYNPQGFVPGLVLSLLGLLMLVLLWLRGRRQEATPNAVLRIAEICKLLYVCVALVVFAVVYLYPLAIWLERGTVIKQ